MVSRFFKHPLVGGLGVDSRALLNGARLTQNDIFIFTHIRMHAHARYK